MNYQNKRKWKRFGIFMLFFLTVAGLSRLVYDEFSLRQRETEVDDLKEKFALYEKELYVSTRNLSAGETVSEENVRKKQRYSDEEETRYITSEDFGKVLLTDIEEGVCVLKSMVISTEDSFREVFLSEIDSKGYLQEGNRVDVRISYGNAEDYVVLSDKLIVSCDEKKGIVLKMTEEEILLLSSALYDCETYKDTELYLVKYPSNEQMEKSPVNYMPTADILAMLEWEDVALRRVALEKRLETILRR